MRYLRIIFAVLVVALCFSSSSFAGTGEVTVFYLDQNYRPVTKLERIAPLSDGMRAILAMYALQNGAGCEGAAEGGLQCSLTTSLGLGTQCSDRHVAFVSSWFKDEIPKMSGYGDYNYRSPELPDKLKTICYRSPDGATFQQTWDIIRVRTQGKYVFVDAIGSWMAREEGGRFRYSSEYRIMDNSIKVVAHHKIRIAQK